MKKVWCEKYRPKSVDKIIMPPVGLLIGGVDFSKWSITLKDAGAQDLADWLQDARANARAVPLDARLTRGSERAPGAPARWSGAVSLSLPS